MNEAHTESQIVHQKSLGLPEGAAEKTPRERLVEYARERLKEILTSNKVVKEKIPEGMVRSIGGVISVAKIRHYVSEDTNGKRTREKSSVLRPNMSPKRK